MTTDRNPPFPVLACPAAGRSDILLLFPLIWGSERKHVSISPALPRGYRVSAESLMEAARQRRDEYAQGAPFPHIVIDNLFPEEALLPILSEFPTPEQIDWQRFNNPNEKKLASTRETQLGDYTRHFLWELNSSVFISFVEAISGVKGLIPDPHMVGGGLHQIERGGLLKVHADFNRYERLKLDRRVNLLLYLNRDWKEEYGGHLQLWDQEMKTCIKKVLPIFNRLVLFSSTDVSFHGHPDALTCPEGWTRKSIAMYYYTNGRPVDEVSVPHSTVFKAREGEQVAQQGRPWKAMLKDFVPPVLVRMIRPPKQPAGE